MYRCLFKQRLNRGSKVYYFRYNQFDIEHRDYVQVYRDDEYKYLLTNLHIRNIVILSDNLVTDETGYLTARDFSKVRSQWGDNNKYQNTKAI